MRQALQNFVFLVSESDLEKCEDLFRFAKVFTKYFHIVHIVGHRVESCMIYRRVLVESTSQSFFILLKPQYHFRLQKGVKNEDEKHFKIFNINQWVLRAHFCLIIPCNQSQVVVCSSFGRQIIFLRRFKNMRCFHYCRIAEFL